MIPAIVWIKLLTHTNKKERIMYCSVFVSARPSSLFFINNKNDLSNSYFSDNNIPDLYDLYYFPW